MDSAGLPVQASGATFVRCALQVNPSHYAVTYRGEAHAKDEETYVRELLTKCVELDVKLIAVTDHNHAGSIPTFRKLADKLGIIVFPGFEIASSEGVHVLCLYPHDTKQADLERFLGQLDLTDSEPSTSLSKKAFSAVLACVKSQGGLTIAAHVTQEKGLLTSLHGQARIAAWRDENLACVQLPGGVDDAPADKRPILRNRNPDYRREPGAGADLAVAVVNASDVAKPEDLDNPSATCWIKASEPSLESLRQAFLDPDSRIRLASDAVGDRHTEFLELSWSGGFLDGCRIRFNGGLNVLVGGRGTGKSTVVESIRCVLDAPVLGEEAQTAYDALVGNVLRAGTRIRLLVRVWSPTCKTYSIERTIPNSPLVRDEDGCILELTPADVVSGAQVFGQHEISELARDEAALTSLLDRFAEPDDDDVAGSWARVRRDLVASRELIVRVRRDVDELDADLSALPALTQKLKQFEEAGLDEKLKDRSRLTREEAIQKTVDERLTAVSSLHDALRRAVPLDVAFLGDDEVSELPAKDSFVALRRVLEKLGQVITAAADDVGKELADARGAVAAAREVWDARRRACETEYERVLRSLQKSHPGLDGAQFIRLQKRADVLLQATSRLSERRGELVQAEAARNGLVSDWEGQKAEAFRVLARVAKRVSRRLRDVVRVEVRFAAVRDPLIDVLRDKVGGRLSETLELLRARESISLQGLAQAARDGAAALIREFEINSGQAQRLAAADPSIWMQVEELELPHTTTISLNVAPPGQTAIWRRLDELSTGQRATAVLLVLLLDADAPIVVDQPEDDLDNRFITEVIVPRIRAAKSGRQFVFSTHNANIPVLADAELVVGLSPKGDESDGNLALEPGLTGSIDDADVRAFIEETLEGGRQAFELRRRKYGY